MSNKKSGKKIELVLIVLIVLIMIDKLIRNLLIVFNIIPFYNNNTIFISFFAVIFLGFFYKHRYWIIASLLLGFNVLLSIIAKKSLSISEFYQKEIVFNLLMILGVFLCLMSFYYVRRFIKLTNYKSYYRFR